MPLGFSANIVRLLSLLPHYKLSRAFNALARAAAGKAMACLFGAVFSVGLAAGQSNTGPTVTISGPTDVQTTAFPFSVTITFSESVTGFEQTDVTVGNGSIFSFAGSGATATLLIEPTASGTVTVDVAAGVAVDDDGNGNTAATQFSVEVDLDAPTVTISGPADAQAGPFEVTIAFSESVMGFEQGDVTVGNGTVTAFSGSGASYTATITPAATGTVTVDVAAAVALDRVNRENTAAIRYSVEAELNAAPVISAPGDKTYEQEETITAFGITVSDDDDDTVTVTLTGLPSGLSYTNGQVRGTVAADAAAQSYTVTIEADDGVNAAVTETFTITVTAVPREVTIADASASEGAPLTFTVTLDKAVSGGLTVTPSFSDGTAKKGTDYTENTAALSFAGTEGETQTFTVATTEDEVVEADESFTVSLTVSGTSTTVTATHTATGTITNDDSAIVTIADASAEEGDSLSFTVTLDKAVQGRLTVMTRFSDGTATRGTDYYASLEELSFAGTPGETQTFTVETIEDEVVEGEETFNVSLNAYATSCAPIDVECGPSTVSLNVSAGSPATGTITDDDSTTVTIADASAEEGDSLTFTVTLNRAVQGGLTVTPSFTDGTATKGTDYTENTGGLSFTGTAGETQTFTVATTEDEVVEADETFTVSLSVSDAPAGVTAGSSATGTITDDDVPAVTIADASAGEGDPITFTVRLDKAVSGGLTVTPSFSDGTATQGTDYTENTAGLSFTGTAGEERTFTVSTIEDEVVEGDETFTVSLTVSGTSAPVTATDTATGSITDDDGGLIGGNDTVTIADASAEEGASLTFTVTLNRAVQGGLTVTPAFSDGTATKGTDYTENTAALSFTGTAGETQTITVGTIEDAVVEGDETFTVSLSLSDAPAGVTAGSPATGTITDDDGGTTGEGATVTIANADAVEGESLTFTVTLNQAVQGGLTVTPVFTNGTATKGTDYTENTAALSFTGTAGETQTITVGTIEDAVVEGDETFTVSLSVSDAPAGVTAGSPATGTITDDDVPAVTIADASAGEGDPITFTVRLNKAVSGGLTVTPSFSDGTATQGTDYTENTAALSFTGTAGEEQTFTVATTEDEIVEENETFTVSLTVSGTSTPVTATDTATGGITDDDGGLIGGNDTVTIADASAVEGASLTFTVTLNRAVQGGLTVTPSFTDGTATKGTDYTENTGGLSFTGTAGETQTFTVATTEDEVVEADETFTVSLSVSDAPAGVTAGSSATGTITDDDVPAVTIADASAGEGDPITFTVRLDKAVSGGLTVTPSFSDGTATQGTDYTENTAGLSFTGTAGEEQTFTVATTEDEIVEENETFTVSLTVSGTSTPVTATDTATGTITDDDGGLIGGNDTVTIADASAEEGESLTFTVTLNRAVQGGLTVTPAFSDGTATEGTDYTENTAALSFTGTAGEERTFTVSTIEDEVVEGAETFAVSLSVSDAPAGVTAGSPATGTITDDDGGTTGEGATVTIANADAVEGESLTFTVTLNQAVQGGLTVTPVFTNGTATKGTDYTENTAALSFTGTAGEEQTITVGTVEDAVVEGEETFAVSLSVPNAPAGVTAGDPATGTITDDDGGLIGGNDTVTIADASAVEGASLTFTVTLNRAVQGGLTVTPSFTDGTATKGTDYTENTGGLSFTGTAGETQTFTVATTEGRGSGSGRDLHREPERVGTHRRG